MNTMMQLGRGDAESQLEQTATVGKDIIELLSTAMYVDPLTVYREYIQNSADAIDAARAAGHPAGQVQIALDPAARTIVIRDDGDGLPMQGFAARLTAVGASLKRGTQARGFRGVGRLSGLAYARALTFRSRARGEDIVSTMRWDCQRMRAALKDPDDHRDLPALVAAVTETHIETEAGPPFFEVRLEGVVRHGDDRLMSPGAVADYLSQVAPLPLNTAFSHREGIVAKLSAELDMAGIEISINGEPPLMRPHVDEILVEGVRPLRLHEISFVEIPSTDGGTAALGWIAHHDYEGAIHPSTKVRGLRVRAGNIQIGDAGVLADAFPEQRFDSWAVGEIHILDPRIVPNGRRDDFERNIHLANLKNHLAPHGREVANRCRTSSRERKRVRDIELEQASAREGLSILRQGSLGAAERDRVALSVELALMRAEKHTGQTELVVDVHQQTRLELDGLREELDMLASDEQAPASPLDRLNPERRAFYEEMFALIYNCSVNRSAAKGLVDRIIAQIA
ncbi:MULTISPECIES: ATP-binding protein [unclassified Sphingopyxis]|uniref:ATP-binding protein n=1 Tax=unclassified Sphingopyxis TaxID=2614943 RepID=UPI00073606FB|nr:MULTISPECIES: ATP-binding protein [unclassified Sphingopyxis]KTE21716.1 hypothetical protein ATE67_03380 [Sphingopyxis sp. H050]KTE32411.1 hypothetical protein ATE62_18155 [Sphingopyxis sp. HIX]KTE83194.1 hypothetical protein ATE72_15340 [Sphingopyxis sp. HXXIV]